MRIYGFAVLLLFSISSAVDAAGTAPSPAPSPDPSIGQLLDQLEYRYDIDQEGDYRLTFSLDDEDGGRSQLVFVRSAIETYGAHRVREIWSPGYLSGTDALPVDVANRLLEATQESKLGGWAKQGRYAVFVVRLAADAEVEALHDAIEVALRSADEMEQELTPGHDAF